jgi:hypothetical protein
LDWRKSLQRRQLFCGVISNLPGGFAFPLADYHATIVCALKPVTQTGAAQRRSKTQMPVKRNTRRTLESRLPALAAAASGRTRVPFMSGLGAEIGVAMTPCREAFD